MNLFFELVKFELKKILSRKRTVIVLALVMIVGALSVFGIIIGTYYYTDENGGEVAISRYEDEMIERHNGEALSGRVIDADLIMEAVEAYKSVVPLESGNYIGTLEYQNHARKYSEIYGIVRMTFHLSSLEEFQNLTREQAEQFDAVRRQNMEQAMMNGAGSENVCRYRQKCLNNSPASLTYEYWGGYYRFVTIMFTTAVMAGAAIAVMISGIFSDEYTSGADSLILSSKHGKGLVIGAKLFTAFLLSAALIALLSAISLVESFLVWGAGGANGSLELAYGVFPYPITIGQAALFYFICMLAGCIMFAAITALFSSKLKLPFNTIVVMIALLIVPLFIAVPEGAPAWVDCLINLLPIGMFTFWHVMLEFQYEILGLVIPPYIFLPVFALIVTCICSYFACRGFKGHQIS
ncbi:MAG: ABC transporter permease [Lachnospiraceae bacterium]|nr:ABC transporter permease [Lachnospiraceae bacterium]MDE7238113.1 ABC transporter permease [Lachnospiraceae bacterium]